MPRTLSALVTVTNAQDRVARLLTDLLEVLPEVVPAFDIWLVDNGSRDETSDTAFELARRFPQLHVLRCLDELPRERALAAAGRRSLAGWFFAPDELGRMSPHELSKAWQATSAAAYVFAQASPLRQTDVRQPLRPRRAWEPTAVRGVPLLPDPSAGWQIVRREVVERLGWPTRATMTQWLSQVQSSGYEWATLELGSRAMPLIPAAHLPRPVLRRARGPWAAPLVTNRA